MNFESAGRSARRAAALLLCLAGLAAPDAQAQVLPTISVDDVSIAEGDSGAKEAVFTVSLSQASAVNVGFMVGTAEVSAVGNDDFEHYYSSPYTIPAGQTQFTLKLVVFGDTVMEADETFQVLLENVSNATVAKGVGIGTIVNDDAGASPTLLVADQWTVEGNSGTRQAIFKVQLSQPAAADVSFSVATSNDTATAGGDYTAVNLSNQVIPAGQLSKSIAVTIAGDANAERDETYKLTLSNVAGATLGRAQAQGTIGNDDAVSPVKISVSDAYIKEGNAGGATATFYVNLSQASASAVTFDIRTDDASATGGSDFIGLPLAGQTIAAGQTTKMITVTVVGDTDEEPTERFLLTLSNVANAAVEYSDAHGVGTIANDDAKLSIDDVTQLEGNSGGTAFLFKVKLTSPLADTTNFQVETIDGTATATSGDFNAQEFSNWQIQAGASSANVVVWVEGDTRMEPDETFTVRISGGGHPITDNEATGTILNDDAPPFPSLYVNPVSVPEGNAGTKVMNFIVTMSEDAFNPVSFDCETVSVAAQAGSDFVGFGPTTFIVPTGQVQIAVPVTISGDTAIEPNEAFYLQCSNAVGGSFSGGGNIATGTIVNDDGPTKPALSMGDITVTETNSELIAWLPVTLSVAANTQITIYIETRDITATEPYDYTRNVTQMAIPLGVTEFGLPVSIRGDFMGEGQEQFEVRILNTEPSASLIDGVAVVTINDDDGAPAPDLVVTDVTQAEGSSDIRNARFLVSLSRPSDTAVTFGVMTAQDTAMAGSDFLPVTIGWLMIPPGEVSKAVSVPVRGDLEVEPDEGFLLVASNVQGANPLKLRGKGTIRNDDFGTAPRLSVDDVRVDEGPAGANTPAQFSIRLSKAWAQDVGVTVATSNGSAVAGADFLAPSPPLHVVIPAGQLSATASVIVVGDDGDEPDETFNVLLSAPEGGSQIADAVAVGTVLDDDPSAGPNLSIGDVTVIEGASGTKQAVFDITLSAPSVSTVSFDVSTANGTASAGSDFEANSVVGASIGPGQTATTFSVSINGDTLAEDDERFSVELSNIVGANPLDTQARGTIGNDDQAVLSIADASLAEGNDGSRTLAFVVSLSQSMPTPVSFSIGTVNGTATAGVDYVARQESSRLLDAGRTRQVFEVAINGDVSDEPDETFSVTLGNVVGAVLGDGTATGTVVDDDPAATPIAVIQGAGTTSPLLGQTVTTTGIVTALTREGYFLQSPDATRDGDEATSDAVFVAGPAADLRVGDEVRVRGQVRELVSGRAGRTLTLLAAMERQVGARGQALPAPKGLRNAEATAPASALAALEAFEGMRVAAGPLVVTAASGGVIDERDYRVVGDGRFHARVMSRAGSQALRIVSAEQRGALALSVDAEDIVSGLAGVLSERDDAYELLPDPSASVRVAARARPRAVVPAAPGEATIGSFDLRRFRDATPGGGEPVASQDAYSLRLAKTAHAICAYARSPAILALRDVERATVPADLAAAVNGRAAEVLFPGACDVEPAYVALGIGTARTGLGAGVLVSTAEVRPGVPRVEVRSLETRLVDERFVDGNGRRAPVFEVAPLLLDARINGEGVQSLDLLVLVVQGDDPTTAAITGDARLSAQRQALVREIGVLQRANPRRHLVVIGGFGELGTVPGMRDLGGRGPREERYSVVRDGRAEWADRVLVSDALDSTAGPARWEMARVNADFGEDNLPDPAVPVRISDHDPLVLFLRLH